MKKVKGKNRRFLRIFFVFYHYFKCFVLAFCAKRRDHEIFCAMFICFFDIDGIFFLGVCRGG